MHSIDSFSFDVAAAKVQATHENGPDLGHECYDGWKDLTLQSINLLPPPLKTALQKIITVPSASDFLHSRKMAEDMRFVGNYLVGQSRVLRRKDHGLLYDPLYNHAMLAERADGKIQPVDYNQIYTLFPQATEKNPDAQRRWPRLALTSHHARSGDLKDVTSITHGIEAMMRQCFDDHADAKHPPLYGFAMGDFWHKKIPENPEHQQLMIAYACDADKNPFLNGAALLDRIITLKEQNSRTPDKYTHASQSAFRLAKVILQCLVTEPERIKPECKGFVAHQKDLGDMPLKLRPDAVQVAQHIALIGYSKGGNVVSDAMRILVDELSQKRSNGESVFYMQQKARYDHGYDGGYVPIHQGNVLNNISVIVKNMPLLSLAALEAPLQDRYVKAGVRRVSINNKNDLISCPTPLQTSRRHDEVIVVDGTHELLGHAPQDALGTKNKKGYFLNDPHARRRAEEFFCALYGAAAISNLSFKYDDQFKNENRVVIEPAAGTSDKMILAHCDEVKKHLKEAGFTGVSVGLSEWNMSEIQIHVNESLFVDKALKPNAVLTDAPAKERFDAHVAQVAANVQCFAEAFKAIREKEPKLVVNQMVDDDIAAHLANVQRENAPWAERVGNGQDRYNGAMIAAGEVYY